MAARVVWLLASLGGAAAFYLPGVAPKEYMENDKVEIKVNKLTSTMTQLPYDYYSLPFCKPPKVMNAVENLGEVLHGSVIHNSPYDVFFGTSNFKVLCKVDLLEGGAGKQFAKKIREDYRVQLIMDNLPAATKMLQKLSDGQTVTLYDRGFRLGFVGTERLAGTTPGTPYLNNHLRFVIKFHRSDAYEGARIVGFEVEAYSVAHKYSGEWKDDPDQVTFLTVPITPDLPPQPILTADTSATPTPHVIFTYETTWEPSDIRWASRWDLYLYMGDDQIHWFSILNSLAIVLLLTGIVAMIMMRTLRRDLNRYNAEDKEELAEESGWKLVHADVLRPPHLPTLLCASIGTGAQLLGMTAISILCAMLGFLSPANRGGLLTATLLLYALMGVPAGYISAGVFKALSGENWAALTLSTALLYPGIAFSAFVSLNFFIWAQGSSGALPFGTLMALIGMWCCISLPLVFVGSFLGYKAPAAPPPVRTNDIPRQVPEQAWYMGVPFTMLVGGILPFGAVFIELFFIMTSVWQQRFYYVFGFLTLVLLILLVTCAEISIVLCYFQLCNEDYGWWWRSFLNSGAAGLYLFAYSFVYFGTQLDVIGAVPTMVYFVYMAVASLYFFLVTGTAGFIAAYTFVWLIYGAVKVD
ncbi:hypothetical protein KFE25_011099 [Diacronema lutheri]|uniref:Transmembrane 9 superfamily member n=3 Tax=Diacronema lutheri TaxID=2081491 RepID=A0A8J6C602_DIALT|nr:hypothetical protein KFE25_011099 [Diacronema lutheri]